MLPMDTFLGMDIVSQRGSGVSELIRYGLLIPSVPVVERPLAPNGIGGFRSRPIGIALPMISRAFLSFRSRSLSSTIETLSVRAHS